MAFRDLVTGGAGCAVPDSNGASSSSNPLGGLATSLLGSSSKTQERLRELPALPEPGQISADFGPLTSLPGSEREQDLGQENNAKGSAFLRGFRGVDQQGFTDAWNDVSKFQPPPVSHLRPREEPPVFADFERIYNQEAAIPGRPPFLGEPPQQVLSGFLRSFLDSSREEVPFYPVRLPELGLSTADKQRIRDRSSIMARHFFAEKGDEYVNAQVTALLQSLDIEDNFQAREHMGGRLSELEQYWNESHSAEAASRFREMAQPSTDMSHRWADEYSQNHEGIPGRHEAWAHEFQSQHDSDSWANQFSEMTAQRQLRDGPLGEMRALEQTRSLVDTLSKNQDPKFQNSKFLQFVSKMSRGELIVEDNQIKQSPAAFGDSWADEFRTQHASNPEVWASEFSAGQQAHFGNSWVDEYGGERQEASTAEDWIKEFPGDGARDWADEFGDRLAKGMFDDDTSADGWLDSYNKFVEEQVRGEQQLPASSKWLYVFADQNPYVGHPNPLKEGQDLFRRGLLSEAVLALEAEVLKNPDNAEGWRLLGITHAENDDDRQAIASMVRARDADPSNLEVLLALGVSHTNELEQAEALKYLRGWLQNHPMYGKLVPPEAVDRLSHSENASLFNEAATMAPEDGDVHTVLGVLYNLSREYDKAIQAFQTALKLKPRDYSLWNKLGATQANSARSADAIYAYQQALDLKPNYVRAWSNMGIGFANQGRYEESIQYYVRALCMNPKADNAWQYLRISLSCAKRSDLLDACDQRDLDLLQKEFPL